MVMTAWIDIRNDICGTTADSIYNENMENDFYTVMQVSRRYKVNKCEFEYIISENPIVSYQEIEIGLSKYHLYCELSE